MQNNIQQNGQRGQLNNQQIPQENQQAIQWGAQNGQNNIQQNAVFRQQPDPRGYGMIPALRRQGRFNPYANRQVPNDMGFDPQMTLDAALETGWNGARSHTE